MTRYTVTLNRDVDTVIGHLVIQSAITGQEHIVAPPTVFTQRAGARTFPTLKSARAFCAAQRADHGYDVCTDPVAV